jgi:hypothetical protein
MEWAILSDGSGIASFLPAPAPENPAIFACPAAAHAHQIDGILLPWRDNKHLFTFKLGRQEFPFGIKQQAVGMRLAREKM